MEVKNTVCFNSTGKLKRVLLCKPKYYKLLPISDVARDLADKGVEQSRDEALKVHKELENVFTDLGVDISWVEPTEGFGWQVSTRDTGVNTPKGMLIGRFRYVERKGEEICVRKTYEKLGEKVVGQITRGCVEGGDCFLINENTLIIGNGNRSTYSGFENAKEILSPYGIRVFVVEFLSKWNHLDMIFSPVAEKLALVCEDAVPDYLIGFLDALGWEIIRLPGEYAFRGEINMLSLGDGKVLSFRGNRINKMLKARGLEVYDPEFSFFVAAGIGPHCATLELEREP